MALAAGQRMLALINSLLDIARLEGRQIPLTLSQVAVPELIESAMTQVTMWAERSHVSLTSQLFTDIVTVYADPVLAQRVLVNLLSNAIKFSRPDTTVTIRVAPADNNTLAFSVSDQGTGIPKEWVDKVFDKFVQVEAHRAGTTSGYWPGIDILPPGYRSAARTDMA